MSAIKTYFKQETQWCMLGLEHPKPADFYIGVWQSTRSSVPLLIFRAFLFLSSVGIVLSSMILYILDGIFSFWFIYLTHWGLLSIVIATGFSTVVSARCYFYGPISAEFCLPWYVKTYWVVYNVANPLAYLITIFYWTVLYEAGVSEELNPGLDVAVHGLNTLVILLLLVSSSHPSRLLHVYQPIVFSLIYVFFGVIYYLAGGVDTAGNRYVYSVIDWSQPGITLAVVLLVGVLLVCLHCFTIGLASARDAISARWCRPAPAAHEEAAMPLRLRLLIEALRQPAQTMQS